MGRTDKTISSEISADNVISTPRRRPAAQPNLSPRSVRSAPATRLSTVTRQTTDKYPSSVSEDALHSSTHLSSTQPLTSAPSIPIVTSASSIPIVTSAPPSIIDTHSLGFVSAREMDSNVGSPQGSISLRPEAQPSGSTAQLGPAANDNEPETVDQSVTRWMQRQTVTAPLLPGTPHSIPDTVPSVSPSTTARRAINFQEHILTPANDNVQNVPPSSARQSVAPSQASSRSDSIKALEEQNLGLARELAEEKLRGQQKDDRIKRLEEIADQMQAFLQTTATPNAIPSAAPVQPAVRIQPSVTVSRINPRAQTRVTPASTSRVTSRVVRSPPQVPHVTAVSSAPAVVPPVSPEFPALPVMTTAPVVNSSLSPDVTSLPIPYAAVVKPSLIPAASVVPCRIAPVIHTAHAHTSHAQSNMAAAYAHVSAPPAVNVQPSFPQPAVQLPVHYMHAPTPPAASHVSISSTPPMSAQPAASQSHQQSEFVSITAVKEIAKLCRQNDNAGTSTTRFKMDSAEKITTAPLRKGERLTSDLVLKWVAAARILDSAARKARSREPETPAEWRVYFKFYIDHMEDGLSDVMTDKITQGSFTSISSFWNAVFNELFPRALVSDAFEDALKSYCIWSEPLGLERWEKVTTLLVQYKEMVAGAEGEALQLAIAEKMYNQLIRTLHQCQERQSQELLKQLAFYQEPILMAEEMGHKPPAEAYWQVFRKFMTWLTSWLKQFSYECTFGFPLALYPNSALKPEVKKHLRHIPEVPQPEPVYTPAPVSAAARQPRYQQRDAAPKLHPVAPNGKHRTWTWKQRTCPDNGPRIPCANEAPDEAKKVDCEFFGDWLDWKGLCTYCTKPGHVKADCPQHKENRAKYEASEQKRQLRMMSEVIPNEQEN
jgi:hypothetical protein